MAKKETLIVSISGIRGIFGSGLDPAVIVRYTSAFGTWCKRQQGGANARPAVVVGRDGRVTGEICARLVTATLQSMGCDVVDAGMATTPTVEVAVLAEHAAGAVMLSASHNPAEWNALKLLNAQGEFLAPEEAEEVIHLAAEGSAPYVGYEEIGAYSQKDFLEEHISRILALDYIHPDQIAARNFKVVVDGINSVGSIAIPALLERLGVREENIVCLNCEPTGRFAHVA
ncbi:MAG TPA: phosphoglucosamine mutase, partial [Rhodothermales bacterium]|nr:phosphoglucosamine mutase [Rhodothermales bacterium]